MRVYVFHVQPEVGHCQAPKHVVVPYVENTLYSANKHSCVRPVHTLYIIERRNMQLYLMQKILYILPINTVVLDQYTHCILSSAETCSCTLCRNTLYSANKYSCVRPVHTLYIIKRRNMQLYLMQKILYILPINTVVLDQYTKSTLVTASWSSVDTVPQYNEETDIFTNGYNEPYIIQ